jgi:hypothetical protein
MQPMTEPDDKHTHNIVAVPLVAGSSKSTEPQRASEADDVVRQRKHASKDDIRDALRTIHSADGDAPNIVDIVNPVKLLLDIAGLFATKEEIQEVAGEREFELKRCRPGSRRI